MNTTHLEFPLDRLGRRVVVAEMIGVSPSTITRWAQEGIPVDRVLEIERVTGIARTDLRPDLFSPAPPGAAAAGSSPATVPNGEPAALEGGAA